jgi:hypothetical protein
MKLHERSYEMKMHMLAAIVLLGALAASAQTIPALRELTPRVAGGHPELVKARDSLLAERSDLHARVLAQQAQCKNVAQDTPEQAACLAQRSQLNSEMSAHITRSNAFNSRVDAVIADDHDAPVPSTSIRIGTAAAVRGEVKVTDPDGTVRTIKSGDPLVLNGHITSGPDSRLQILLADETVFTIGPNADMVLDKFVYDPDVNTEKFTARIVRGVFRLVTGRIARRQPDTMNVRLNVGVIGIRGTDFEILTEPGQTGYIKLFSGEIEITLDKDGSKVTMHAGEMIPILLDGNLGAVEPLTGKPTLE